LYKWPNGRVIRTICLILVLLITADIAHAGAYGKLVTYHGDPTAKGATALLVVGIFFAVLALAVLVAGVIAAGFNPKSVDFLIEVEGEMQRVEWPKPDALIRQTLVIAVAIAVLSLLIVGVDWCNLSFINLVRSLGGNP
jgi:preprotein translocase SecE subunit